MLHDQPLVSQGWLSDGLIKWGRGMGVVRRWKKVKLGAKLSEVVSQPGHVLLGVPGELPNQVMQKLLALLS